MSWPFGKGPGGDDLFRTFWQFDPNWMVEADFRIPRRVGRAGEALNVVYRSGKKDPETLRRPRRPVDYIHENDPGVEVFRTDLRTNLVMVPEKIASAGDRELALLGKCLSFAYRDESGEEVEATCTRCELYAIPSGRALVVVEDRSKVQALIYGGRLGVEARGIVH